MSKPTPSYSLVGFVIQSGNLYGFSQTSALNRTELLLISSFTPYTAYVFEYVLTPGASVEFYVDDVLKGTITTNVPNGGTYATIYNYYAESVTGLTTASIYELRVSFE